MSSLSTNPKRVNERHIMAALGEACEALGLPCQYDSQGRYKQIDIDDFNGEHAYEYTPPGEYKPTGVTVFCYGPRYERLPAHRIFTDRGLDMRCSMTKAHAILRDIARRAREGHLLLAV